MTRGTDRRHFLRVISVAAVASACGAEGPDRSSTSGGFVSTSGSGSAGGAAPLGPDGYTYCGNVSGLPEGALIGLRFKKLVVGRDALGVYVMTSVCTHEQCNMLADGGIDPGEVICGCHKSIFDAVGQVTKGPAKKPLDHYATVIDEAGDIFVHIGEVVPATTRVLI
jgi:nitrite reductase/ring-hydroxylating ferredoxin subunit